LIEKIAKGSCKAHLVVIVLGDLGYHVQMRDLHHARGSASGHYNDRGGKSGGDEERGRERDRYNERDRNRGWQCDADSARDRDRDRGSDREREYTRQRVRGTYSGEDRGWDSRDRNDRNNERDRNKDCQRSRDRPSDSDRDRGSDRDRQYTLTQRPSKQFNIELNKQLMRISDTRQLCDFVSTHAAEFNHVNVATSFRKILQVSRGGGERSMQHALDALEKAAVRVMEAFQPQEIANILHITAKKRYKT